VIDGAGDAQRDEAGEGAPGRVGGAVFLLTDYGNTDEFAGVLRAVVVRHAPGASVIDLTHEVPAHDVRAGALTLQRAVPHLGPGVVLAVVDPGVGTHRRAVALSVARGHGSHPGPAYVVGPDNGLLPWAVDELGGARHAVVLPAPASRPHGVTFDGRDLLAPAAARLWRGEALAALGPAVDPDDLHRLEPPRLRVARGSVEAEVLWVDRFGNVQLSARPDDAERAGLGGGGAEVEVDAGGRRRTARRVDAFAEVAPGGLGLLVDANGRLALVGDRSSAAAVLGVGSGDRVRLGPGHGAGAPS